MTFREKNNPLVLAELKPSYACPVRFCSLYEQSNTSLCQDAELDELLILLNVVNPAGLV